jgi:hypothetical protein
LCAASNKTTAQQAALKADDGERDISEIDPGIKRRAGVGADPDRPARERDRGRAIMIACDSGHTACCFKRLSLQRNGRATARWWLAMARAVNGD